MRLKCVLFVLLDEFLPLLIFAERLSKSRAHLLCLHSWILIQLIEMRDWFRFLCSSNFNFEFDYHPIKSRWIFLKLFSDSLLFLKLIEGAIEMASFSVLGFLIFCTLFGSGFRTSGDRHCTSQVRRKHFCWEHSSLSAMCWENNFQFYINSNFDASKFSNVQRVALMTWALIKERFATGTFQIIWCILLRHFQDK